MLVRELLEEPKKSALTTQRKQLNQFMQQRGYRLVGQGYSAAVFAPPQGQYMLKVYGASLMNDSMIYDPLEFYNLARKLKSEFLPRFGTAKKIRVGDVNYTVIPTERLSANPADPLIKQAALYLGDGTLDELLQDPQTRNIIATVIKKYGRKKFERFYPVYRAVCVDGHDCEDLRMNDNMMFRGNTPVINDPWSVTDIVWKPE